MSDSFIKNVSSIFYLEMISHKTLFSGKKNQTDWSVTPVASLSTEVKSPNLVRYVLIGAIFHGSHSIFSDDDGGKTSCLIYQQAKCMD